MKTWKKVLAVMLVCLCVCAAMMVAASAADVQAADGVFSGSFWEFLIRLPVRIVHIIFTIIKAPFVFIGSIFGL